MSAPQAVVPRAPAALAERRRAALGPPVWSHADPSERLGGSPHIMLGFKRVGDRAREHWLNSWAAWWTRRRSDVYPAGAMCHAELFIRVDGPQWHRVSINMGTIHVAPDGSERFEPGTVFLKPVTDLNGYVFLRLALRREKQYAIYRFVCAQLGSGFNKVGYYLNFLLGTRFGVSRFHNSMFERPRRWFCSELICAALQSADLLLPFRPCQATPNMLYRECRRLPETDAGLHPTRPGGNAV